MTLIELLVSLGVLAVISIAFATILSQSQRVVDRSSALMRANATASAISQTLRDDLACFCPQGFLAIYDPDPADPSNNLVFTSVGAFTSLTDPTITANAARIDYGRCDLDPDPNRWEDDTLWRRATLLTGTTIGPIDGNPLDDRDEEVWLGRYDSAAPAGIQISVGATALSGYCQAPTTIPRDEDVTAANAHQLWPLLARPCGTFRVSWWDVPTRMWETTSATVPSKVWTSTDFATGSSPPALKVNLRLKTGGRAGDYIDYEIICPLRP